jgi:folate-binding protein YgfZ
MTGLSASCLLDDLGVLRFRGADVRKFLQGQLSNDIGRLSSGALLRAGVHNPQGRTMALLALAASADGDVLALMPRDLIGSISTLLKRYVLRSKVTITDETAHLRIVGLISAETTATAAGQRYRYGLQGDERALLLQDGSQAPAIGTSLSREQWRALDIAAGLPQVSSATSGHFVAQMLNLDCIDAISFDKGCYTGQEIIARAHYRGRVKRRMQRFISSGPQTLAAGASGRLNDGRNFRVVEATVREDGRCEFLAVAHLPGAAPDSEEVAGGASRYSLAAQALPLPYGLA